MNMVTVGIAEGLEKAYESFSSKSFLSSYAKVNNLQVKETSEDKRNKERKIIIRETVGTIERRDKSTSTNRLFGSNSSLNGWDRHRKRTSFETVPEAIVRK